MHFNKYTLCTIILSIILSGIYIYAEFKTNTLHDSDPYEHAITTAYIADRWSIFEPDNFDVRYLDSYPPLYGFLMAPFYKISGHMNETLKIINSLLCGLAIFAFFLFAKELFKDEKKGFIATGIIFALPCFMSHFIWSQSLAIPLILFAWYAILKNKTIPALILTALVFVSQPSCAVMFIPLTIILVLCLRWQNIFVLLGGGVLSLIYWLPMVLKNGLRGTLTSLGFRVALVTDKVSDTSGGRIYSLGDIMFSPLSNKIDQATGIGLVVSILVVIALLIYFRNKDYIRENRYTIVILLWFILCLLLLEGNAFPIKLFPHRVFVFLALPISLLAADAIYIILHSLDNKGAQVGVIIALVILIGWTSFYPKYIVQTSLWAPGRSWEELQLYTYLKDTYPANTRVFQFNEQDDRLVLGMNMYSCCWCKPVTDFRKGMFNRSPEEIYAFFKDNDYKYLVISAYDLWPLIEQNRTTEFINRTFDNGKYALIYRNNAGMILTPI